jgi:hypothetical protein
LFFFFFPSKQSRKAGKSYRHLTIALPTESVTAPDFGSNHTAMADESATFPI